MKPEIVRTILLNECSTFNKNGFDTDIDLYVSLIEQKKYKQASALYEKHLIPRYPDEQKRIRIIRYYRKKDHRFSGIYAGAVRDIFSRIVSSVKQLILHVTSIFGAQESNPYELLRKIELALRVIPHGKEEGIEFLEKMETYSQLLDFRTAEFARASDILKRYFDNTLFVKIETRKEKKKEALEAALDEEPVRKRVTIDLDKIEFSENELRMICIDSRVTRRSFQVLAYCRLYWRQIFNQDFEKKVFLYSKKYNTIHYRIFQIIKNCRVRKIGDEVILLEIYSLLSNGYQYSLMEDVMMQDIWRRIKPVDLPAQAASGEKGTGEEAAAGKDDRALKGEKETAEKKTAKKHTLRLIETRKGKSGRPDAVILSLADKLDRLSMGDAFNAHEEFSSLLPKYVEKYLVKHRKKDSDRDPYVLKGAQYIITTFISDNYGIVSPDWKGSISKTEVTNMGFLVPEIETVITLCLEEVRMRRAVA